MAATCQEHADRPVQGTCATCGRYACDLCLVDIHGTSHCKRCLAVKVKRPERPVSSFMRFILSLVPGAGHMYLGLMNRGLQLMVLAVMGSILLGMVVGPLVLLFIAGVVFYSVFDSREAYLRIRQGEEVPDVLLVNWSIFANQRWIAYGLILIGAVGIYQTVMGELVGLLSTFFSVNLYRLVRAFEGTLVGLLAIGGGLWLLKRGTAGPGPKPGGEPQ